MGIENGISPLMVVSPTLGIAATVNDKELKGMTRKDKSATLRALAKNHFKTGLKDAVIVSGGMAAAAGTAQAVKSSKFLSNAISKCVARVKNGAIKGVQYLKTNPVIKEGLNLSEKLFNEAAGFVKTLPGPAKIAAAAVGLITFGLYRSNHHKESYNSGKIVQQGIDKSKLEQ